MISRAFFRPFFLLPEHLALKQAQSRHQRRQPGVESKGKQSAGGNNNHGHDGNTDNAGLLRKNSRPDPARL